MHNRGRAHGNVHAAWPASPAWRWRERRAAPGRDHAQRDHRRLGEHGRLRDRLSGPKFEEMHPDVEVQVTGTGPGDAGSQKIYEKLEAQKPAGAEQWRRRRRGGASEDGRADGRGGLLAKYRDDIETGKLVSRDTAKKALGTDVEGYVMPMFHSQTAIAYNADLVREPPRQLRGARELGPGAPRPVRLQRHPRRHVRRRLRGRLDLHQYRRRRAADERSLRRGAQGELVRRAGRASRSSTSTSPSPRATPARSTC